MTFPQTTWTSWMLALALSLSFSSCRLVSSLGKGQAEDLPYGKETQLAYFEGQATCSRAIWKMPTRVS